jgi:outer membrane protein assembly factor BamE
MQMPSFYFNRIPSAVTGAFILALAAGISGCASKNPLIDEPVAAAKNPAPAAPAAKPDETPAPTQTAEAKPAAAASDLQTTRQRRFLGIFSPYRPDIQQGNFVSREMVAQLREGMTPEQVRFVLGTPLLRDVFHANRWDYPFRLVEGDGKVISSRVTVYFKDNRLARIEGGDLPSEKDFLLLIAGEDARKDTSTGATPRPASPVPARPSSPAPTDPINRRR